MGKRARLPGFRFLNNLRFGGYEHTPPAPRFRPVLGLAAPAAPFGSFGTFRDLGSPEPQNMHVHVLGFLADRPPRQPTFRPRAPLARVLCDLQHLV